MRGHEKNQVFEKDNFAIEIRKYLYYSYVILSIVVIYSKNVMKKIMV